MWLDDQVKAQQRARYYDQATTISGGTVGLGIVGVTLAKTSPGEWEWIGGLVLGLAQLAFSYFSNKK